MIYRGIKTEIGGDAAKAFVHMVGEMTDDASATTFLTALKRLERNEWQFTSRTILDGSEANIEAITDTARDHGDDAALSVFFGVFSGALAGRENQPPRRGEGLSIVGPFLDRHKGELDKKIPKAESGSRFDRREPT